MVSKTKEGINVGKVTVVNLLGYNTDIHVRMLKAGALGYTAVVGGNDYYCIVGTEGIVLNAVHEEDIMRYAHYVSNLVIGEEELDKVYFLEEGKYITIHVECILMKEE